MLSIFRSSTRLPLIAAVGLLAACITVTGHAAPTENPQGRGLHGTALQAHFTGAPITTASLSGTAGNNGWYLSAVTVTLTATANGGPGVKSTFYSIDGGSTETYSAPFSVTGNGTHTLTFYSTAIFGIQENQQSITIKIDMSPPSITFGALSPMANDHGWNNSTVAIPFTVSDAISGIASSSSSPMTFSAEGSNQSQYATVTNNAGYTATIASPSVNIDMTPPESTAYAEAGTNSFYVDVDVTDNLSGVAVVTYSLDGSAPQTISGFFGLFSPYSVVASILITSSGQHTLTYYATDNAGNAESPQSLTFNVGTFPPSTVASLSPNSVGNENWFNVPVTVTLISQAFSYPISATYYTLDGGPRMSYTTPFVISNNGVHTVTFYSVDTQGNAGAPNTIPIKIDTTPPVTTASIAGTLDSSGDYIGSAVLTLSATDNLSGVAYTICSTEGITEAYPGPITFSIPGTRTISFYSYDNAGNYESSKTVSLTIEALAVNTFPEGLQLISVPSDYSSIPLSTLLSEADPLLAVWNPSAYGYIYSPSSPADALRPGYGYWADLAQPTVLYNTGVATPTYIPFQIPLSTGWNMIGDPFPADINLNNISVSSATGSSGFNAAVTSGVIALPLYSYDSTSASYVANTTSLTPYVGYWIYAYSDCVLDVSSP